MTTINYPVTEVIEMALSKLFLIQLEKERVRDSYICMQMNKIRKKGLFGRTKFQWSYEEAYNAFYSSHFDYFSPNTLLNLKFSKVETPIKDLLEKAVVLFSKDPNATVSDMDITILS